jgi:hypothetical protein
MKSKIQVPAISKKKKQQQQQQTKQQQMLMSSLAMQYPIFELNF